MRSKDGTMKGYLVAEGDEQSEIKWDDSERSYCVPNNWFDKEKP